MRISRRELEARNQRLTARNEQLSGALTEAVRSERATASQLLRIAGELSDAKDEIALHIVAAKHPSSALSDAHSMGVALQEALAARGVDLRIELARLEGADL